MSQELSMVHHDESMPAAPKRGSFRLPNRWRGVFLLALMCLFSLPAVAFAGFPRGTGFYFSIPKIVGFLAFYMIWMATCRWVDQDAYDLHLPTAVWNPAMVGAGLFGILLLWVLPWFAASFPILVALYLGSTLSYVNVRNKKVPVDERVLSKQHFKDLLETYLKIDFGPKGPSGRKGPPVEFVGKSNKGDDPSKVAKAAASRGYLGAKEMVWEALQKRATDIHLEPTKDEMVVRFRVDGILHTADPFSRAMGDAVINIFKVLADLDITEKRKPQDGGLSARVNGDNKIDFRVATAGSVAGEKMVMRILDKTAQIIDLTQLGMRDSLKDRIHEISGQPHGMLIVCGPTGAGKSTTLYACLNEIDRYQKNVITVENPVEYNIENVTQIEVNPKAGKTFAGELRSILRQDPDVIYIGEIRDQETAEIACQAAQTGHMVFTTLHANDTVTAVGRLVDLGVQPFMVADAVSAILGQRLVRLLCPKCKVRYKPDPALLRKANMPMDKIKYFYRPPETPEEGRMGESGEPETCDNCGGTGYRGRTGIFELLVVTDKIRDMIRDNPNLNAIRQEAVKGGMKYLQEDGLRQVIEGKTSIQELMRVAK
jgi:type II secretory ATPase GspE/PulE/Tfp pilus assembly ATPase PilB-like protein